MTLRLQKQRLDYLIERLKDAIYETRLTSVNLALSNQCHANCIYCPKTRGKRKNIHMSFDIAKKIADEVASKKFRDLHDIRKFQMGENGDALLNQDFIHIIRYFKKTNPDIPISLFTNFHNLTKDKSEIMIKERLIDKIHVNIDGHDSYSYFRVKKIPYKIVEQNLIDFIAIRNENNSYINLTIISLTFADYIKKIYKRFGKLPVKIKDDIKIDTLIDDFELIKNIWVKRLNPKIDIFNRSSVVAWAERETVKYLIFDKSNICPNLYILKHQCFIAPDGDIYACCLDDMQNLVFGNIIHDSINDIYFGEKRSEFLRLLKNRQYSKIGNPCVLVESCKYIK